MTAEEHLRISFGNDSLLPPIGDEIVSGLYPNSRQRTRIYKAMDSYATDRLESYKEALRADIEKERDWFENVCEKEYTGRPFKISALNRVLELIDTTQPLK